MLLGLLLPDPCDDHCPEDFKQKARELLPKVQGEVGPKDKDLQKSLLKFIGDFANWNLSSDRTYLEVSRGLVKAAHPEETPLVVDPFAGGGSIPLEALRLGCETFASDLNPVACLILKILLEDIPKYGPELAEEVRGAGTEIKSIAERELPGLYPLDPDGSLPVAFLWARTVQCESPKCGSEIPLVRSFWLSKKSNHRRALKYKIRRVQGQPSLIEFEIFEPRFDNDIPGPTVTRARATCLCCNAVLAPDRVRSQLAAQRGGANVIFDHKGHREAGARLLAVAFLKPGKDGRDYRLPTDNDYDPIYRAGERLRVLIAKNNIESVPSDPLPWQHGHRAIGSPRVYGMTQWGDLFTERQQLTLLTVCKVLNANTSMAETLREIAALAVSRWTDIFNAQCVWEPSKTQVRDLFSRQALPMRWDFAEPNPLAGQAGDYSVTLDTMATVIERSFASKESAQVQVADARYSPLPDQAASVWFTDPPYYDAVPYADLSDFFLVWLKRCLPKHSLLRDPFDPTNPLTPKYPELTVTTAPAKDAPPKTRDFFENGMASAFCEGRRTLQEDGMGCVVFAHKTTEGWEALLSGIIDAGLVVTSSWPISTEMSNRVNARETASLATSIHLVCRPRPETAPVGDWVEILRELPGRVRVWIERLESEGVRGADLVFACIGPALEIYSRYSKVVDAEDREIPLGGDPEATEPHERGYLAYVWEAVGRAALEQVLGTTEAAARNGAAGALEEDARLTALFLWTLQSTNGEENKLKGKSKKKKGEEIEDEESEGDEEDEEGEESKKGKGKSKKGYSLVFDVVRRFAQPLGIHLDNWEDRIIETDKGIVRLLPVGERGAQLFGQDSADLVAERLEREPAGAIQMPLFPERTEAPQVKSKKRKGKKGTGKDLTTNTEATTLDRVHAAMLLQASGRTNALRALLQAEQDRGPDFLRLANALSALYPRDSEEKRLLDAMLLAVPR
jgi:adenine-specific DNA methylase